MKVALWDLDNTLADDEHRIALIHWHETNPDKRYEHYHMMCGEDRAANVDLFNAVSFVAQPIFCTARPEAVRTTTEKWIRRHLGYNDVRLMMRQNGQHLGSAQLKILMAERIMRGPTIEVIAAFDDREDVVRAYRSLGIPAARLWVHDVCAMTPPKLNVERIDQ